MKFDKFTDVCMTGELGENATFALSFLVSSRAQSFLSRLSPLSQRLGQATVISALKT